MRKVIITILGAILLGGVGLYLWQNCHLISDHCCEFDSDEELISRFSSNRPEFDGLIEMARADSELTRIAFEFTQLRGNSRWPRPESELGLTHDRWNLYKEIFAKLRIRSGLHRPEDSSTYYLIARACGLFTNRGGSKGYAYSLTEPRVQVESLDNLSDELVRRGIQVSDTDTVYKRIGENWYLYQDF